MSHLRQLIRTNIVTTLTGLTTTASRVFASRIYPLEQAKLAGLCIYTSSESTEYDTISPPRRQTRTLQVIIEIYASATSNLDNTLDTSCKEIEEALYTDLTRGGYAKDTRVISFESEFNGDGEKPVGVGRLTVEVIYSNRENEVESAA
jgi:hypothetical protein